jgi:hypothetical protein
MSFNLIASTISTLGKKTLIHWLEGCVGSRTSPDTNKLNVFKWANIMKKRTHNNTFISNERVEVSTANECQDGMEYQRFGDFHSLHHQELM